MCIRDSCRAASKAPRPKRKTPASRATSFFELATEKTEAPTDAHTANLKTIERTDIANDVVLHFVL